MLLMVIIICEIAFWVAILAGLATRYLLRQPRLGAALLALGPIIDAALLTLVTIDLLRGSTASWHHGLAALYIGYSIAYGKRMIAWADVRFKHAFANGSPPEHLSGRPYTIKCWHDMLRTTLAVGIAAAIIGVIILLVNDAERTSALSGYFSIIAFLFAIDFVWALSYTAWPKKSASTTQSTALRPR